MVAPLHSPRRFAPLVPEPMDRLDTPDASPKVDWLWHGLIARGNITLFTSQWKAGKTTLLTGLLQTFAGGGSVPWGRLAAMLGAVLVVGLLAAGAAVVASVRTPIVQGLRRE